MGHRKHGKTSTATQGSFIQLIQFDLYHFRLGGWATHLKNISQIGSFPQGSGENQNCLKPPPSLDILPYIYIIYIYFVMIIHFVRLNDLPNWTNQIL